MRGGVARIQVKVARIPVEVARIQNEPARTHAEPTKINSQLTRTYKNQSTYITKKVKPFYSVLNFFIVKEMFSTMITYMMHRLWYNIRYIIWL